MTSTENNFNFANFCENNGFIGFTGNQMKTEMKMNKETGKFEEKKSTSPFRYGEKWMEYTKSVFDNQAKTNIVITGKLSNITVIDFDDLTQLEEFRAEFPEFTEKCFQETSWSGGVHFFTKYREDIGNVSNDIGIDFRNDGGCLFTAGTEVIRYNGKKQYYKFKGGEILEFTDEIATWFEKRCSNFKKNNEESKPKLKEKKEINIVESEDIDTKEQELQITKINKIKLDLKNLKKKRFDEHDYYYKLIFGVCNYLGVKDEKFCKWITNKYCNQNKIDEFDNWFKSNKIKNNGITYGTIEHWVKEDTAEIYFIKANDICDEYKVAEIISKTLKETLIYCNELWYMVNEKNLWKTQKDPAYYITREFRKYCDYSIKTISVQITETENENEKENLRKMNKTYNDAHANSSKTGFKANIIQFLKTLLSNNEFYKKLDVNSGKLAFMNGIMDLKTRVFTQGIKPDDFITNTIPYEYKGFDESKLNYLKNDVLKKILNNDDEHLEYFLSIIGYTFIGQPNLEKSLYFGVDKTKKSKGDNGKTFYFDILTTLLPNYVYKSNKSLLQDENKKVHKQLVNTKGKRLVWLDEFDEKKTNPELMKILPDGLTIENEIMFGTTEIINILFKLFILTNLIPNIDAKDTAVYNRFKQISYGSHFDRTGTRTVSQPEKLLFIADTELGDKIKNEYYNEVFELIISYAHKYYTNKIPKIPIQFINDTKETQNKNDEFKTWFEENCVIDNDGRLPIQLIVELTRMNEKKIKEGMNRLDFDYVKDLRKMGKDKYGIHYKGGFEGVKIKPSEDEDDDTVSNTGMVIETTQEKEELIKQKKIIIRKKPVSNLTEAGEGVEEEKR